jgi:hypothetical protein
MRLLIAACLLFLVAVAIVPGYLYVDSARRQRAHAANMARAEAFKRELDAHLAAGVPRSAVEAYLATKHIEGARPHPSPDSQAEYWVTITKERSPNWYCGLGDVGLILYFSEERRLTKAEVASWSFDCP